MQRSFLGNGRFVGRQADKQHPQMLPPTGILPAIPRYPVAASSAPPDFASQACLVCRKPGAGGAMHR
jgi:hypothetical protein